LARKQLLTTGLISLLFQLQSNKLETAWRDTVAKEKAMEEYVDITLRFWADFSAWHPTLVVWYTMLGFGGMSAWTITRFISAPPLLAGPVSFLILTYAAMIANFASRSQIMMGTSEFEKTLCFTVLAHAFAALIILAIFRVSQKTVAK
jgi:hypothetical protein